MFDIRPVDPKTGDLDWEKIRKVSQNANIRNFVREYNKSAKPSSADLSKKNLENGSREKINKKTSKDNKFQKIKEVARNQENIDNAPPVHPAFFDKKRKTVPAAKLDRIRKRAEKKFLKSQKNQEKFARNFHKRKEKERKRFEKQLSHEEKKKNKKLSKFEKKNPQKDSIGRLFFEDMAFSFKKESRGNQKSFRIFIVLLLFFALLIGLLSLGYWGLKIKNNALIFSQDGYFNIKLAVSQVSRQNFEDSQKNFSQAAISFQKASEEVGQMGTVVEKVSRFFPYLSKVSSAKNVLEAANHLSLAGTKINEIVEEVFALKNLSDKGQISMLEELKKATLKLETVRSELSVAQKNIDLVKVDDLPEEFREKFVLLKTELPDMISLTDSFLNNGYIFSDMLGSQGPRKYLFLFQNNNEMRATGGFIGSYGLLDISNGRVKNFFIDGIFNPDGQLIDKVVPPEPIQKISAAWSLHDSNWFADFPTSAQEAIVFYEKTGGPTVDGVITLTPTVLQKLLKVTGPIEMPDYDVILDSDNFIEKTQYEVEVDYDKEENKPKEILSDLAPILLDRISKTTEPEKVLGFLKVLSDSLKEKHILIYSENADLQKIISQQGWSGEILDSQKDYLSVVNTNINGFKTDGVIEEDINQEVEISDDGSIVDTVSITRRHNGGDTPYEWWNKVNANYLRIYVPLDSELISVEGQTREFVEPPLDYDKLGFKRDEAVQQEADSILLDEQTNTRIYQQNGKTVFANWTYVSPGEEVTVVYKYKLPFRLFSAMFNSSLKNQVDSYSLLVQKQSGSLGSDFNLNLTYPSNYQIDWTQPNNSSQESQTFSLTEKLDIDRFIGVVFEKDLEN